MVASISLNRIEIPAGQRIYLHDIDWREFEQILVELGEKRATRIAYFDGDLEIRMPLPEHERAKEPIRKVRGSLINSYVDVKVVG